MMENLCKIIERKKKTLQVSVAKKSLPHCTVPNVVDLDCSPRTQYYPTHIHNRCYIVYPLYHKRYNFFSIADAVSLNNIK